MESDRRCGARSGLLDLCLARHTLRMQCTTGRGSTHYTCSTARVQHAYNDIRIHNTHNTSNNGEWQRDPVPVVSSSNHFVLHSHYFLISVSALAEPLILVYPQKQLMITHDEMQDERACREAIGFILVDQYYDLFLFKSICTHMHNSCLCGLELALTQVTNTSQSHLTSHH